MVGRKIFSPENISSDFAIISCLAALKLLLHFLTNGQYGYFRDELYFLDCGEHLDWGYVDHSPLIAVVAKTARTLLGESLFAIRFFPAVAGAALVFLTGLMARALGGGRFAIVLACLAVIISPSYLFTHTILTMNAFEPLFWMLCAYVLMLILKGGDPRLWLLFGLCAGVGLMNKHSMLIFGFSAVAGLLLSPQRKHLLSRWLWLGGLIAFLIFLPNIIWQIRYDWPTVEVLRNAAENQNLSLSPLDFLKGQILLTHPLAFPLWVAGLYFYLFSGAGRQYRSLGWSYVVLFVLMLILEAKIYYLAPVYPVLLAPGARVVESFIGRRGWNFLKPITVGLVVAGGLITAPLTLPVLPVGTFIRYAKFLGVEDFRTENLRMGKLPQHYADMFGWPEMTAKVAEVYHSLPPEERARCAIFTSNFGEAGAIDFFGRAYNLPRAISKHQNYFLWGPREYTGECVITVGEEFEDVSKTFDRVELAATINHEYAIPHQNNSPVFICRQIKMPLKEIWPQVKCYSC